MWKKALFIPTLLGSLLFSNLGFSSNTKNSEQLLNQITAENAYGNMGITTSPALPLPNKWDVTLGLDVLFWQLSGEYNAFGKGEGNLDEEPFTPTIVGTTRRFDFNWDTGVRAMIGVSTPYDAWDILLSYVYFATDLHDNTLQKIGDAFSFEEFPTGTVDIDDTFNFLQFELGRGYFISPKVVLRPSFGFESAWIDLKYIENLNGLSSGVTFEAKNTIDYWGIGPRAGFNSKWFLGKIFSFYTRTAAAIQYGIFDVFKREALMQVQDTGSITLKLKSFHRLVPHAELELGIATDFEVNNKKQIISIKLGYEVQYWWRLNQYLFTNINAIIDYTTISDDISTQGFVLGAKVLF